MNEKDLQSALQVFSVYKNERKRLTIRVASLLSKTKMNEKDLQSALQVFSVFKNERKRLASRVASLFSIQK
jgi:hypothetical protein